MNNPELGQVEAQPTFFDKALESLRNTRLGNMIAVGSIAVTGAVAANVAQGTISPDKAEAALECTTTTTTSPDGTATSTETTCSTKEDVTETTSTPRESGTTKPQGHDKSKNKPDRGDSVRQPENPKLKREKWPIGFVNYDQGDWPHPSTGCGPTAYGMVAATLKGNRHITPASISRSISPRWYNPGVTGTAPGAFFAMGKRHGLKVKEFDGAARFQQAKKALKKGGLAIIHAVPGSGYFTQDGHYLVLKRLQSNKFRIADPNGRGLQGNSEARSWSPRALKKRGIGSIWTFQKKR